MKTFFIYILILTVFTFSCKKAEDRACLKFVGDDDTKIISLGKTDSLFLYDNIIYCLIPDTTNFVELKGGENLLNHVECSNYNDKLEIRNNNTCNFLRSYKKKVKALIHITNINFIHFEGTEKLSNEDTLKSAGLRLVIRDGAGSVELTVDNSYMSANITHGWGDFTLHGKTVDASLNCNTNSFCNTVGLKVSSDFYVYSNTGGDMIVNSEGSNLQATIKRNGNILYFGTPNSVEIDDSGSGEVLAIE